MPHEFYSARAPILFRPKEPSLIQVTSYVTSSTFTRVMLARSSNLPFAQLFKQLFIKRALNLMEPEN